MRIQNLATLRLGVHLMKRHARRGSYSHVAVQAGETKTNIPFEWPLEKDTAQLLADYVSLYRPALPHASGDWLFPSKDHDDRPRTESGLGKAIKRDWERRRQCSATARSRRSGKSAARSTC